MSCDRIREQIADYLAGRLEDAARGKFEAHTESCAACRAEIEELSDVWQQMDDLPAPEPDPAMRRRFLEVLEAYQAGMAAGRSERPSAAAPKRSWSCTLWPARPAWQAVVAATLVIAGRVGGRYAFAPRPVAEPQNEVAQLRGQVESLRQLVALSLLQEQSPSSRLRGVNYAYQVAQPDDQVEQALLRAVNHDSNVNVRLSAVDALQKFAGSPDVRRALADAIPVQDSPLVQVAIIDLLAQLNDRDADPVLRKAAEDARFNAAVRQRAAWALKQMEVAK